MKLLGSPASPFVRKVLLAAALKGVSDRITLTPADTNKGDPALNRENPLGKIPCLVTGSVPPLYDSHVICEYLDSLSPSPVLFPKPGPDRWRVLTMGALCDGILDAALLLVYEGRFRPEEKRVEAWVERQQSRIDRALDHLEPAPPSMAAGIDYGHVTLAAALGYLDFRHGGKWRAGRPKLVAWLDAFSKSVPAFEASRPSG